jgi:hypothetical protein
LTANENPADVPGPSTVNLEEEIAEVQAKDKDGIVIFFSSVGLSMMQASVEIYIDGTFGTCPHPFKQILFIQAKQAGKRSVPVVFALLSKKVPMIFTTIY